ncbi:hypothetical protein EDC94DRAFT_621392 [Helicostylum pulchrum]|nr:hypothetical protein EDC94DRAFT_621392 [Helicostylum pulchrum]
MLFLFFFIHILHPFFFFFNPFFLFLSFFFISFCTSVCLCMRKQLTRIIFLNYIHFFFFILLWFLKK